MSAIPGGRLSPRLAVGLLAGELLQAASAGQAAQTAHTLGLALTRLPEPELRQGIIDAIHEFTAEPGSTASGVTGALWEVWQSTRHPELDALLERLGQPAAAPPELYILSRLRLQRQAELQAAGPEWVEPLLRAANDPDPGLAQRAQGVLSALQEPAAQEEVCRWVIERDDPLARQVALAAGYLPQDPQRRALYFLLTEQWERYEALDFDASLLRAVYRSSEPALRLKIADLARQAGWAGFVDAVAGEPASASSARAPRRLEELSEVEWEVVLVLLSRHHRWDELWRLAQTAPPVWSARLLHALRQAGWSPAADEPRAGFFQLVASAESALPHGQPPSHVARPQPALRGHTRQVTALGFLPAPFTPGPHFSQPPAALITASADRDLHYWNLPTSHAQHSLSGHTSYVATLSISPDARLLASGGADHTVRLWQLPAGGSSPAVGDSLAAEPLAVLGGHRDSVTALAFSPDGRWLASGDAGSIHLWRLPGGKLEQRFTPAEDASPITYLAFRPDGALLLSHAESGAVHWWPLPALLAPGAQGALAADALPGGLMESAAVVAPIWNAPANLHANLHSGSTTARHLLVSASRYGRLRLWGLGDEEATANLAGLVPPPGELLYSLEGRTGTTPDGVRLAIHPGTGWVAASDRQELRLWRLPKLAPHAELTGHLRPVQALAFSPDAALLASGDEQALRLWDTARGTPLPVLGEPFPAGASLPAGGHGPLRGLAFSSDGAWLAARVEETVQLWGLEDSGHLFYRPPAQLEPAALAWAEATLKEPGLPASLLAWLSFSLALVSWQRRHDIALGEGPDGLGAIALGEFDIEIV